MILRRGHSSRPVVMEDPDRLGYWLGQHPLLSVMSAAEWAELESSALAHARRDAEARRRP